MVLPNVQTVFGLDTFLGDAGPDDFGLAIDVGSVMVECALDFLSKRVCPWLSAENAVF